MTVAGKQPDLASQLATLHLRYLPEASGLRVRAMAQLVARTLYTETRDRMTANEILAGVATLTEMPMNAPELIKKALGFMHSSGIVEEAHGAWRLSEKGRRAFADDIEQHAARLHAIFERRFPEALTFDQLLPWFNDLSQRFFSQFGSSIVAGHRGVGGKSATPVSFPELVHETLARFDLLPFETEILSGFQKFIEEPTQDELAEIWCAWQAAFAARLIVAAVGADPVSIAEIRDADVFLDTNVLITAAVETRPHHQSIAALARALLHLGLAPHILDQTVSEYTYRVKSSQADAVALLRDGFEPAIVAQSDVFARAAYERGSRTPEEFERYFANIAGVPESLGPDLRIEAATDSDDREAAARGENDAGLVETISHAERRSDPEKSRLAAQHDAALMAVIEQRRRNGRRDWVLTEDLAMCRVSSARSRHQRFPSWIGLETLIEILALSNEGPALGAEDFGGLLAAMFRNDLHPSQDTFELVDLVWLRNIEADCRLLPREAVERVALEVTRSRLEGRGPADEELHLRVKRAYLRERQPIQNELEAARAQAAEAIRERDEKTDDLSETKRILGSESERLTAIRDAYKSEVVNRLEREDRADCRRQIVFRGLLFLGFLALGLWLVQVFSSDPTVSMLSAVYLLGISAAALFAMFKAVAELRRRRAELDGRAEREIQLGDSMSARSSA